MKGTFSTVDQANKAAETVLAIEYPNCMDYAFIERGHSQDPWKCSDEEIGEAQLDLVETER